MPQHGRVNTEERWESGTKIRSVKKDDKRTARLEDIIDYNFICPNTLFFLLSQHREYIYAIDTTHIQSTANEVNYGGSLKNCQVIRG